jgi:hypothetical protein
VSQTSLNLSEPEPEWLSLLRAEIAKGRTITDLARQIDMPRPSLSMLLAGNYPARLDKITRKFSARVVAEFRGMVLCPHLKTGIAAEACQRHAAAPMSTNNPDRLRFWAACRACPLNPVTAKT